MRTTYTPEGLRLLSYQTGPQWEGEVRAALKVAADIMDAADAVINERKQVPMTDEDILDFGHRIATKYTHRSDPISPVYGFLNHTLIDFVRAIEKHHGITSR